jgi:outer membrane immunogenic protein
VRARAGVAFGPTLMFITGGLAVGGVNNNWTWPFCCELVANDKTEFGWTAGGGIEHAISGSRVSVKAEVLYVDLGRSTVSTPNTATSDGYTARFKNTAVIGRLGLNLKW